jgi:putative peptide zinc metalloprotease protein
MLLGAAVMSGVAYAWWPGEARYRPIEPWERGTVGDIVYALGVQHMGRSQHRTAAAHPANATRKLVDGQRGVMRVTWDNRTSLPTRAKPRLAVVLVPKATISGQRGGGGGGGGGGSAVTGPAPTAVDKGWVFPFDKPLVPGPGDTQALAVNTVNRTVDYEAAFALIWETDEEYAMNINDAEAYASCIHCGAVAIAYQVVFVIDNDGTNDNVAAPQNLAGALSYDCINCMTYALAQQLFITLDEPLSPGAMAKLDEEWAKIAAYQQAIEAGQVKLTDIQGQLQQYTDEIKSIVEADQPGTFMTSTAASTTAAPTSSPSASPSSVSATPSTSAPPPTSSAPQPSATAVSTAPSEVVETPSTTTNPTTEVGSTSTVTTSDESTSTDSTASSDPGSTGTASGDGTSSGATSDGAASGGTTAGGTTSGGTATSP